MSRTMYDSVNPHDILVHDPSPDMVAGYINGSFEWAPAEWDLFPNSVHVTIATSASFTADVLDVEPRCATPAEVPDWITQRRIFGNVPIVYTNRDWWDDVQRACAARNVAQPLYWIATASGTPVIPGGAIGAQYRLDWQGVDLSIMDDYIPGIDASPSTQDSNPTIGTEDTMTLLDPGTDVHVPLIVPVGATDLYIAITGYGDKLTVHQGDYFGDTGADPNGTGVGGGFGEINFAGNRPGPIRPKGNKIPAGARMLALRYTSNCKVAVDFR